MNKFAGTVSSTADSCNPRERGGEREGEGKRENIVCELGSMEVCVREREKTKVT